MYKLGFCVYGPQCRYRHTRLPAPAPEPESIEAAKPREFRDQNKVVNFANPGMPAIGHAVPAEVGKPVGVPAGWLFGTTGSACTGVGVFGGQ